MNKVKSALESGQAQHGIWLNTGSDAVAEMAGRAGFDWCLIDCEHGPNNGPDIGGQLRALEAAGCGALVRIVGTEHWMVKQVIDLGAQNVMVPMVEDAETARRMAEAMRYPPHGTRGMGAAVSRVSGYHTNADYVATADAGMMLIVQAESAQAVENIDAIAAVDGVDCVFIGPADLAASLGHRDEIDHPDVAVAMAHIIDRTVAAGKIAGILAFDPARFAGWRDMGVRLLGVGSDVMLFSEALRGLAAQAKG